MRNKAPLRGSPIYAEQAPPSGDAQLAGPVLRRRPAGNYLPARPHAREQLAASLLGDGSQPGTPPHAPVPIRTAPPRTAHRAAPLHAAVGRLRPAHQRGRAHARERPRTPGPSCLGSSWLPGGRSVPIGEHAPHTPPRTTAAPPPRRARRRAAPITPPWAAGARRGSARTPICGRGSGSVPYPLVLAARRARDPNWEPPRATCATSLKQ